MSTRKIGYVSPIGEYNNSKFGVFVETAGYRTAKQQIDSFVLAGESLNAYRVAGLYDSEEFDPEDDPSLDIRDYELSEIGELMQPSYGKVLKEEEKPVSSSLDTDSVNTEPEPVA